MKSLHTLLERFGSTSAGTRVPAQRMLFNPVRDWTIGLVVATLYLFLGIGYIAYDFHTQYTVSTEVSIDDAGKATYRGREVRMYAEQYTEKENYFNALRNNKAPISVPKEEVEEVKTDTREDTDALAEPELGQ